MSVTKIKYWKQVQCIPKRKRKLETYNIQSEIMVDIPEIKRDETELVALSINVVNVSGKSIIKEYLSHDGKIYEPYEEHYQYENADQYSLYIQDVMNKAGLPCQDREVVKTSGATHQEAENIQSLCDLTQRDDYLNDLDEDDVRKYEGDNNEFLRRKITSHVENHYVFIDGHLFVESIGPVVSKNMMNTFSLQHSYIPDLFLPGQSSNAYNENMPIPVSMAAGFCDENLTLNHVQQYYSESGDNDFPNLIVFDMDILNNAHKNIVGPMLYEMCFGQNMQGRLTRKHNGKIFSETDLDNYLENIYEKYPFGQEFKMLITECQENDYDFESVKNAILFIQSQHSVMSKKDNYIGPAEQVTARKIFNSDSSLFFMVREIAKKMDAISDCYYNKVDKPTVFMAGFNGMFFHQDNAIISQSDVLKP